MARVQIAAATLSGNSLGQTVHTHCASVRRASKLVAALLSVICLERDAELHMAQLMPLTVSCFSKIQIGFTFLVLAHPR